MFVDTPILPIIKWGVLVQISDIIESLDSEILDLETVFY
tara:strand:- start:663 stop:779 length:117 start_codon:yes stop_codon:yes gene_type:complete